LSANRVGEVPNGVKLHAVSVAVTAATADPPTEVRSDSAHLVARSLAMFEWH
jgi:hypothetical protein